MSKDFFTQLITRKTVYQYLVILILFSTCQAPLKKAEITSPDGSHTFVFQLDDQAAARYSVIYEGREIIGNAGLGFAVSGTAIGDKNLEIVRVENTSVNTAWQPVYGEKNEYPDVYEESLIVLNSDSISFNIRVRAYNEGVAFRYEFPGSNDTLTIQKELTEFVLPPEATAWASLRAQSEIMKMPVSAVSEAVERPLLVELSDSLFIALGEANLVDFARMKFNSKSGEPGTLVAELSSEFTGNLPLETPWRFVMAAAKPGHLLERNYLLLNLSEPNQIDDTSWIKTGKVIREVTLTTQGGLACVDFAVKHNLQFIEFDAGWYGNEYDDASDATTVTVDPRRSKGPLDLPGVIQYAKSKDIGVILYVNRRALEKQLDDILPLFRSWGVSGIKYGFVNVGSQQWTNWLHDAVRKAADHQLMIDIHDEYRPTGYSRTYPNLMTQEGIRGDEESPDNSMVLNTLFTRMIAGAGDHTNCYFSPRVTEKMGSHASQLAKAVCLYSPWQFLYWYDRPEGSPPNKGGAGGTEGYILDVPELAFFDQLPTVWDDTRVLDGYPGDFAVIARRSGNDWFIGALNGSQERDFQIPFNFLDAGKTYEATIYADDESAGTKTKVAIEKQEVAAKDVISRTVLGNNGLAIHIKALN